MSKVRKDRLLGEAQKRALAKRRKKMKLTNAEYGALHRLKTRYFLVKEEHRVLEEIAKEMGWVNKEEEETYY